MPPTPDPRHALRRLGDRRGSARPGARPPSAIVDVVDMTWIGLPAARLAAPVADPRRWARWWPGLPLRVSELRGELGVRWSVPPFEPVPGVQLAGRAELWLRTEDRTPDGTVAYFILRLDPAAGQWLPAPAARRLVREHRTATKRALWGLADELDHDRLERLVSSGPAGGAAGR